MVTAAVFRLAEAEVEAETAAQGLPWTPEARGPAGEPTRGYPGDDGRLHPEVLPAGHRGGGPPGREPVVTAEVVDRLWAGGQDEPSSGSPRRGPGSRPRPSSSGRGSGKAAERRARRLGAPVITSPLLTRFRNQAMMKAVKRIRELGFQELTFDAFDAAKERIKLVSLNPEAQERLDRIRHYFEAERHGQPGDFLGQDLMRRFRAHLRDPASTPLDTSDSGDGR